MGWGMSDKVEQIMKRVHLLFSKCDVLDGSPDKIAVPRKQVFGLLEELNYAINDVLEQYEATAQGRERGKRRFDEQGAKIVEEAKESAEDVFAASMLYTDRMLIDLRNVVEQAGRDLQKEYEYLAGQLESQIAVITNNQDEVRTQLQSMSQQNKYMDIITNYNDKLAKKRKASLKTFDVAEDCQPDDLPLQFDFSFDDLDEELSVTEAPLKDESDTVSSLNGKRDKKQDNPVKKVASVIDESAMADKEESDTVKRVSYEIKVNPYYTGEAGIISSDKLDAEYDQWKKGSDEIDPVESVAVGKKKKKKKFRTKLPPAKL